MVRSLSNDAYTRQLFSFKDLAFPSGLLPSPLGELEGAKYLIDGNAKEKDDDCNEHHQENAKQIRVFGIDRWEKIEVFIP